MRWKRGDSPLDRPAESVTFAQQLVDRNLLGPVGRSECLDRADVSAYERRRQERLAAVADVTAADVAAGVPYR